MPILIWILFPLAFVAAHVGRQSVPELRKANIKQTKTMNLRLNVQHFSIASTNALDSWVEQQILELGRMRQIDEANVKLTRHADSSPAFEVEVHLVTPGPDVFAESRDHTLRAAFTKVMAQLRVTITSREAKRLRKTKSQLSAPPQRRAAD